MALACEAAASAFLFKKKKKKSKQQQKQKSAVSALCCLLFFSPWGCALLRRVSVSPAATRAVCVIWLTLFLCLFPSLHSPSLAGSLSLRLPRSLARSERVLGGRSAAAFSTGHPAPRAALAPPRPPLPAAEASGCSPHPPPLTASSHPLLKLPLLPSPPLPPRPRPFPAPVPCKLSIQPGLLLQCVRLARAGLPAE